jgi:putative hydrolase of the HAD superfamily
MKSAPAPFVFFDVGGTLLVAGTALEELVDTLLFARRIVRSPDAVRAAVAAAEGAADPTPEDDRARPAAGRRELYARLFHELGLDDQAVSLASELWAMSYELAPPVLAPGTPAALDLLKGAGARLGVISNWDESLDDVLARTGVRRYLEVVVSSSRVGWSKPNRRIFEAALAEAGVEAARAWHVGDDLHADARGAVDAGLRTVLVDARREAASTLPPGALHATRVDHAAHLLLAAEGRVEAAGGAR